MDVSCVQRLVTNDPLSHLGNTPSDLIQLFHLHQDSVAAVLLPSPVHAASWCTSSRFRINLFYSDSNTTIWCRLTTHGYVIDGQMCLSLFSKACPGFPPACRFTNSLVKRHAFHCCVLVFFHIGSLGPVGVPVDTFLSRFVWLAFTFTHLAESTKHNNGSNIRLPFILIALGGLNPGLLTQACLLFNC